MQKCTDGSTSSPPLPKKRPPSSKAPEPNSSDSLKPASGPASDASPFLKWAGGKRKLLPVLLRYLPRAFRDYHEPCLGGGALFFTLRARHDGKMYLSDVNPDLVCAYQMVRDRPARLLSALQEMDVSEERYLKLAAMDPDHMSPLARAARCIYLNRCGFNGLWRVNQSGKFNTPWAGYRNPFSPVPDLVLRANAALQGAVVKLWDAAMAMELANPGDLVYLDPPYDGTFAAYSPGGFDARAQERIAKAAHAAAERGVLVMASNADTPRVRQLYKGFRLVRVTAPRSISCKASTRTTAQPELLMLSWR